MKKLIILLSLLLIVAAAAQTYKLLPPVNLEKIFNLLKQNLTKITEKVEKQNVVYEESVITKVVEDSLPSVVTVGMTKTISQEGYFEINPLDPFLPFRRVPGKQRQLNQNIGSGFIVSSDGLIITNKHVVEDTEASYRVLTNDKKKYDVQKIYRDSLNDLAILKINPPAGGVGLKPLPLGDSSNLKLGQMTIAIGTPLGEFTNTVTSGIISGLGRGITAGSPFEGYVEKLDNVIQTDAAISPGNSGGPLLNSKGQVIGINTAIASEGENIGFAIPVSVVKELLDNFNRHGGSFEKPYIGIRYQMIDKQTAINEKLVEGAYVVEVIAGSPAEKAGIQAEDIITQFDGQAIKGEDEQGLAKLISDKNIGDRVTLGIWRDRQTKTVNLTLEAYK